MNKKQKAILYFHQNFKKILYIWFPLVFAFLFILAWYLFFKVENENFFSSSSFNVLSIFFVFYYAAITVFDNYLHKPLHTEFINLIKHQKERIKILNRFVDTKKFYSNRSIYNELMSMLNRCINSNEKNISLKMLMCAPLIDYPENIQNYNFQNWGYEFQTKITQIATKPNLKNIELVYLPDNYIFGINPLKEFIESLAGYCISVSNKSSVNDSTRIFNDLMSVNINFVNNILPALAGQNNKIKPKEIPEIDVPFQIFLYKTNKYKEVLVAFAGKTILQDEKQTEQKGFHSTDNDVVEAFEEIYKAYVEDHRRNPIKPQYSIDIINNIKNLGKHIINNYLDLGINLTIEKDMYSPAFANSSKFTSKIITEILSKNDKVLDIGSGSGVQAIVSYKILKHLGNSNPLVFAIEPFDESFNALQQNIDQNNCNINIIKCELGFSTSENGNPVYKKLSSGRILKLPNNFKAELLDDSNNICNLSTNGEKLNIIIGDLPFVDTEAKDNLGFAFFDYNHNAHNLLFNFFSTSDLIADNAKLITSFSTLSGLDDLIKFEKIIKNNELCVIQRYSFTEDDYLWYVYIIMKNNNFDKSNFWWDTLKARDYKIVNENK